QCRANRYQVDVVDETYASRISAHERFRKAHPHESLMIAAINRQRLDRADTRERRIDVQLAVSRERRPLLAVATRDESRGRARGELVIAIDRRVDVVPRDG